MNEYDRMINDQEQIEYLQKWNEKQKLKKNKRKEKINKIKEIFYGESSKI